MTNANMFDLLDRVTDLVEADNPDGAYRVIKDTISNDPDGRARWFLSSWVEHLISKPQKKFDEIVMVLREDYPQLTEPDTADEAEAAEPETTSTEVEASEGEERTEIGVAAVLEEEEKVPATATASAVMTEEPQVKPKRKYRRRATTGAATAPPSTDVEHITLTFYDWQMAAIHRAALKQKMDENTLVAQVLVTGNARPLAFARYKAGGSSPDQRITLPVPVGTKEKLEKEKNAEGIKTTTKYVRRLMFGNRAEKR